MAKIPQRVVGILSQIRLSDTPSNLHFHSLNFQQPIHGTRVGTADPYYPVRILDGQEKKFSIRKTDIATVKVL